MEIPVINLIPPSPGCYIKEQYEMNVGSNDDLTLSSHIDDKTITPEDMEYADDISASPSLCPETEDSNLISTILEGIRLTSRKKKKGALINKSCSGENVSFNENSSNPNEGTSVAEKMPDECHFNLHDKLKDVNRPKRARSPVESKVTNDYSQPPEKFASVDKHVSLSTPFRSRLSNTTKASRASSGAAKNMSQHVARAEEGSKSTTRLEPTSNGSELGMRVSRRPERKVEPFKYTEYKSGAVKELNLSRTPELPRTEVKVFGAGGRTVQCRTIHLGNRKIKLDTVVTPRIKKGGEPGIIEHRSVHSYGVNLLEPSKHFLGTRFQPFSFDNRDQEFMKKKLARMKKSEEDHSKVNQVVARPAAVLYKKPFIPTKSSKEPTLPRDPKLHTENRAHKREEFEEKLREDEEFRMNIRRQRAEEQQRKDAEELAQLRKALDFKARPAPIAHPFVVMKSTKMLTEPESPECSHSYKLRNKFKM